MSQSLPERAIDVSFKVVTAGFGPGGQDTLTLSGLGVYAQVQVQGGLWGTVGQFRIEGMRLTDMNRLSVANPVPLVDPSRNQITVKAGTAGQALSTLFIGEIREAYVDFSQSPAVAFVVTAQDNIGLNAPATPTSFQGSVPAATVLQTIAAKIGLGFSNYGITALLQNPYFPGSAMDQIERCCRAVKADHSLDNGTLCIWPDGQGKTDSVPVVSSDSGLIGYPAYSPAGTKFRTLYNPALGYRQTIKLQSAYQPAGWTNWQAPGGAPPSNGQWIILSLSHELQTQEPGGPWFTDVEAALPWIASNTFG